MELPAGYISLNRKFSVLKPDASPDETALSSYGSNYDWKTGTTQLGWDELLERDLVVILGEPGSGKSYEMKAQVAQAVTGVPRFFLRLDDLAFGRESFSSSEAGLRFGKWMKGSGKALFFLDSVDEAKIVSDADFHRALDKFAGMLGQIGIARSTIVISSRITEWKPTTDEHEVRSKLGKRTLHGEEDQKKETSPLVVSILPLDRDRVDIYINAKKPSDSRPFLEALDKSHAWEYARRPADVDDLYVYWEDHRRLGTLTEILNFVCDSQLRKTSDRERTELLSLEKARTGAECLAAATVLCRKFVFRVPGEPNNSGEALDPLACLPPDWKVEDVRALFDHAVFDGASYGHIRFHHRRLSEFLASRWFRGLMDLGCPVSHLEEILFSFEGEVSVLRPSLAPIAAWLSTGAAQGNVSIFRQVLQVAPEIFLRYGDPAALTIENRRELLRSLVTKADGRERLWWENEKASLSRLADPELAPDVGLLLTDSSSGPAIKELALEIVTAGNLKGCVKQVLDVAIEALETGELFPDAANALESISGEVELRILAEAANKVPVLPQRVCITLSRLLFPGIWSVNDLFRSISRMKSGFKRAMGWDHAFASHLSAVTDGSNGLDLLKGLLGHSVSEEEDEDDYEVPWSLRAALSVCSKMLEWNSLTQAEAEGVAQVLVRAGNWITHSPLDTQIPKLIECHPNVRESYFKLAVEKLSEEHSRSMISLSSVGIFYRKIPLKRDDLSWALRLLDEAVSVNETEQAIHSILDIWHQTGKSRVDLREIKRAVKKTACGSDLLRKRTSQGIYTRVYRYWHLNLRYKFTRHGLRRKQRELKKWLGNRRGSFNLWRKRSKLRSGEYAGWLVDLAHESRDSSIYQYSRIDWDLLRKNRGSQCAKAVAEGCQRLWENYTPPLAHERASDQGHTNGTIAGLAGIQVAWQTGNLVFSEISSIEAKKATRYALNEINGFPVWFDELVRSKPDDVICVLRESLDAEWKAAADSKAFHTVLHDLCYSETSLPNLIQPLLLQQLNAAEPKNTEVLRYVLCVVSKASSPSRHELESLSAKRVKELVVQSPSFPLWMAMWLQTDATAAIEYLDTVLSGLNDETQQTQLMVSISVNLGSRTGDLLPLLHNPSWRSPQSMRKFVPLVYNYIRLEDDEPRPEGVGFSRRVERDDAETFRGQLLGIMVSTGDPEIAPVLREFLDLPLLLHLRDYIKHLLEVNREQLSEARPMTARDVRTFANTFETEPKTDADLFQIGVRRLLEIKRWVEKGEKSPRKEVNPEHKESGFRDWLERKMNEKSNNRFTVVPEWEIVGGRPDLRLVIPGVTPVSLELKIADNWTLDVLLDGLDKQLIGKYLHDDKARYGIYVLALFNPDWKRRSFDRKNWVYNDEILAILQERLREKLADRVDIEKVEIVLINFALPEKV